MREGEKKSRRDLFRNAATLAASLGMTGIATGQGLDDRPFKLGLIGCGNHATLNLIPAALRVPGIRFTAVCDIIPARAANARRITGGGARVYDDYRILLREADVDAVIIATPLLFHRPMVEEAFKNGRHVFCETIMGYSIEDCKAMLKAQKASGKTLQIGHHLRYHPLYQYSKDHFFFWWKRVGRTTNIHCQWNVHGTWHKLRESLNGVDYRKWGYDEPGHVFDWHLYRKYSGGVMTEMTCNQLDIVNWFLEDKLPEVAIGVGQIDNKDGRTNFDNVHLIYEYPDGIMVTCDCITTNSFSPFGEAYVIIQGTRGAVVMAHLARYVGLFFLEPGAEEELWMPAAHRVTFETPNAAWRERKGPIILKGGASGGTNFEKVGNVLNITDVVDLETAQITKTPYQIEMLGFKKAALDEVKPFCDGQVGLRNAATILLGLEAMERKQRIVVPKDIIA